MIWMMDHFSSMLVFCSFTENTLKDHFYPKSFGIIGKVLTRKNDVMLFLLYCFVQIMKIRPEVILHYFVHANSTF